MLIPLPLRNRRLIEFSTKLYCRISTGRFGSTAAAAEAAASNAEQQQQTIPLNEGPPAPVPSDSGERQLSPRVRQLVDQILALSVLEVSDLNHTLKKRLNIPDMPMFPAGGMMMAAPAGAAKADEDKVEAEAPQKTSFAVKLTKFDDTKKIALIKEIRNYLPGMNLVQAKKFVETAPVEVKNDLGKTEAEAIKKALEAVGATIEIV